MSDVAAAPAVDTAAAPAPAGAAEVVAAPAAAPAPAVPTGPLDRDAARAQLRSDRAAAAAPLDDAAAPAVEDELQPVIDEHGRKHHPGTGEYLPGEAEKPSILAAPPAEAPAATGVTKVPVPEGHPWRDMGLSEVTAASPLEEQAIRAAMNSYTRRQEVERLAARNAELEAQIMRREAAESAQQKWRTSPEYAQAVERYHKTKDLEDAGELLPGTADRVWKADIADVQRLEQAEIESREVAAADTHIARHAEAFTNDAYERTSGVSPEIRNLPEFDGWFVETLEDFNGAVERGRFAQQLASLATPEERASKLHEIFRERFGQRLLTEPRVADIFRRQQEATAQASQESAAAQERARRERAAADAAAVEAFKKEAAKKRLQAPPHPLATPAAAARPGATVVPSGEADLSKMSPHEAKEYLRARNRESARALTQT